MKSKLTTTFALVGVLAVGTAAAAVNTRALNSHTQSTIGAGTPALVPLAVVDPSITPSQLDANVTQAPIASAPVKKAAKKASASPSSSTASATATTTPTTTPVQPSYGDDANESGSDD